MTEGPELPEIIPKRLDSEKSNIDLTLKSDNQPADVEQRLEVLENKIFDYINSKLIEIKQEIKTYPKIEEKVFEFENNQSAALEQRLNVLENKIVDYVNLKVTEIKQETKTYSEIEEKVLEFENKFEKFQDKCEHATLVQPKEKQPESQFSQNNYSQLISENQFLRSENMTLKSNLKMLEEKIQSLMEHKRQDVIPQVSTSNSFSLLADHNNNISNDEEETELKAPISNQPHCEIRFVMDSHGNGIDPKRIYKNKDAELIILGKGEKSINGAKNYCDSHSSPKHLVLGVGNNDLEKKSTSTCIADIKYFISAFLEKNEDTTIHVLPAFERVNKATFNSKCADFNTEMKWFCSQNEKCEFIENKLISSLDPSLFSDGIHFSNSGKKSLVRIIKAHLNPHIGLKPYEEYFRPPKNRSFQQSKVAKPNPGKGKFTGNHGNKNKEFEINKLVQQLLQLAN
ncbi:unnamed protein product [Mytilus edulis]|uniref:Uncharacterized protein n=1 Tax=Mytilus edulis TaxID=6550 RepID=A0A8S3UFL9_MYTED|nr:unnamed protein product [Mytilus edulis]